MVINNYKAQSTLNYYANFILLLGGFVSTNIRYARGGCARF